MIFRWFRYLLIMVITWSFQSHRLAWGETPSNAPPETQVEETKSNDQIWIAHILRQIKNEENIPFLEFKLRKVPISLVPQDGILQPMIMVEGTLEKIGWSLSVEQKKVLLEETGKRNFQLPLFIKGRVNEFTLVAQNSKNEILREKIFIFAPHASEYIKVSPWNAVMLSLGLAGLSYYQSDFGIYQSIATLVSARYAPLEGENPWSWATQLEMTIQTLTSKPIRKSPQLIEGKLSGAYRLIPKYDPRLSEQILFGASYLTMLSNGSPFGFANLLAPELGWRFRWKKDSANFLVGDLRFLFLSTNIFKERGFEIGASWSHALKNLHNIEYGFSYSSLVYQPESEIEVNSDLLIFKIGYSL